MVTEAPAPRCRTVYGALADPTRRAILDLLKEGALRAGELADRFPHSRPAISKHLRILRGAGLVRETKRAQTRVYSLDPDPLVTIDEWLNGYRPLWSGRLPQPKRHIEKQQR